VKKNFILFILLALSGPLFADLQWRKLETPEVGRYDDVHFLDAQNGWAVGNFFPAGQSHGVIFTHDGGKTWKRSLLSTDSWWYRSVKFLTLKHGFIGGLANGTSTQKGALYETQDGGETWEDISAKTGIPESETGPAICGLYKLGTKHIYGVGAYYGPAYFYRSDDAGKTWIFRDLSHLSAGLVDIHMFNRFEGFASGASADGNGAVVLATYDGGNTWKIKYKSGVPNDWYVWKFSFLNRFVGYASIESALPSGGLHFIKTTNGGRTWKRMDIWMPAEGAVDYVPLDLEGIGFVNERHGWAGGWNNFTQEGNSFETEDGGMHWRFANVGNELNRFFFLGKNLGYLAGSFIYKWSEGAAMGAPGLGEPWQPTYTLTTHVDKGGVDIEWEFTQNNFAMVNIVDGTGRSIRSVHRGGVGPGVYRQTIPQGDLPPGTYTAVMHTNSRKLRSTFTVVEDKP
jgi:photosystem II stability/assembly factor-like uncharacterized protein